MRVPDEDRPLLTPGASNPDDDPGSPTVEPLVAWTGDRATYRRRLEAEAETEEWRTAMQDYKPSGAAEAMAIEHAEHSRRSDLVFKFPHCNAEGCQRTGVFAGSAADYDPDGYRCRKHRAPGPRNRPEKGLMRTKGRETVQTLPYTAPPPGGSPPPVSEESA
ncbi:MAG: hypothetical protein WD651_06590 [Acidimicrobiia bacterium]